MIAVQNQLQQVQSNIAEEPVGRLGRAWATAVNGLGVMAAAVLVGVVWLTPVVLMAGLVLFGLRCCGGRGPPWAWSDRLERRRHGEHRQERRSDHRR
ncbi:MAG: hypothetical protein ACJ745_06135 [Actinomycetes bacterium]